MVADGQHLVARNTEQARQLRQRRSFVDLAVGETHPHIVAVERKFRHIRGHLDNTRSDHIHRCRVGRHQPGDAPVLVKHLDPVFASRHLADCVEHMPGPAEQVCGLLFHPRIPVAEGLPTALFHPPENVLLAGQHKIRIMRQVRMLESFQREPQLTSRVDRPHRAGGAQVGQSPGQRSRGARIRLVTDEGAVEIRAQQTYGHRILLSETDAPCQPAAL